MKLMGLDTRRAAIDFVLREAERSARIGKLISSPRPDINRGNQLLSFTLFLAGSGAIMALLPFLNVVVAHALNGARAPGQACVAHIGIEDGLPAFRTYPLDVVLPELKGHAARGALLLVYIFRCPISRTHPWTFTRHCCLLQNRVPVFCNAIRLSCRPPLFSSAG